MKEILIFFLISIFFFFFFFLEKNIVGGYTSQSEKTELNRINEGEWFVNSRDRREIVANDFKREDLKAG